MTKDTLKNVKIAGISCAVPKNKVCSDDSVEQFGEKSSKKVYKDNWCRGKIYCRRRANVI